MTTDDIERMANRGNLAAADFDVGMMLRQYVLPAFLQDVDKRVGKVSWRRQVTSVSVIAGTRSYALPADFWWMAILTRPATQTGGVLQGDLYRLQYLGENDEQILLSEYSTQQSIPTGYYLMPDTVTPFVKLWFNAIPDRNETVRGLYYRRVPFADNITSVDLNPYIPQDHHAALADLLRAEILHDRYGAGDDRYITQIQKYEQWIERTSTYKEAAHREMMHFVR